MSEMQTKMEWHPNLEISKEAADTLWERAASRVIEAEDRGQMRVSCPEIWRELHADHPELYPAENVTSGVRGRWWDNPDWKLYLAIRRQEHVMRTMPVRLQVDKYHSLIMERVGSELIKRLAENPDSFSNKELLSILKQSAEERVKVDEDIRVAKGDDGVGAPITINAIQFIERLPPAQRPAAFAYLAEGKVSALLEQDDS